MVQGIEVTALITFNLCLDHEVDYLFGCPSSSLSILSSITSSTNRQPVGTLITSRNIVKPTGTDCSDSQVAGVTPASMIKAGTEVSLAAFQNLASYDFLSKVGSRDDVDTVFISCTSLRSPACPQTYLAYISYFRETSLLLCWSESFCRTSSVAVELENILGKPVTSSNLCLAWHILATLNVPAGKSLDKRWVYQTISSKDLWSFCSLTQPTEYISHLYGALN